MGTVPDESRTRRSPSSGREGLPLPLTTNVMTMMMMMMIAVITLHPVRLLLLSCIAIGLVLNLQAASPA